MAAEPAQEDMSNGEPLLTSCRVGASGATAGGGKKNFFLLLQEGKEGSGDVGQGSGNKGGIGHSGGWVRGAAAGGTGRTIRGKRINDGKKGR